MTMTDYPRFVDLLDDVSKGIDAVLDSDAMDDAILAVVELEGAPTAEPGEPGEDEAMQAEDAIRDRALLILINELVQRHGLEDHVSVTFPRS